MCYIIHKSRYPEIAVKQYFPPEELEGLTFAEEGLAAYLYYYAGHRTVRCRSRFLQPTVTMHHHH